MAKKSHGAAWSSLRTHFNSIVSLFMVFALLLAVSLTVNNKDSIPERPGVVGDSQGCDLFSGRWVYDNRTRPLYSGLGCSFINEEIACDKFGRNDTKYQRWRWQPNGCDVPRLIVYALRAILLQSFDNAATIRFNSTKLLERLRGKRMVFVGDSLNRNQWVSMVCLLESSLPTADKSMAYNGSILSFKAKKYNATVDFYWSPLLLESNCDDPVNHRVSDRMIRAASVEKHAKNWADADILIFNSYLWWKKPRMKMKILYGSFDDEEKVYDEVEMIDGFQIALKTWSEWLEINTGLHKKQFYFMSLSPTHVWGEDWGMESNQNCYNETEPITEINYRGRGTDVSMMQIAEGAIKEMRNRGVNIQLLNVTQLSEYRKDGHPSIYRKFWDSLSEDQLANPSSYSDCTHWCLPGVPDVWNELLYAYIFSEHT